MRTVPLLAGAALLAACHAGPSASPSGGAADDVTAAAPDAKPGVTLRDARLALPAIRGNPGALYFGVANSGKNTVIIAAIHVDGVERAEPHQTMGATMKSTGPVPVPPGGGVTFAPGARHVMLFGLSPSLVAGGATEMTLSFADGDKISAPVAIAAAGSNDAAGR